MHFCSGHGLEFLDVTSRLNIVLIASGRDSGDDDDGPRDEDREEEDRVDAEAGSDANAGLSTTARLRWTRICS